ncbi:MAG TPA: ABC transporter ATP-binding protein [Steroidobacteraceae bacterium]|nr:ABC transporter ATP-binding protein [Steroidobacteraceae bacterium]
MAGIVSLAAVGKGYLRGNQRVEVLQDVNLDVAEREFLALMGPSGSGKTTLLNIIGGLDRADQGKVTVAGSELGALSSSQLSKWRARHIGFVFQLYNLMPGLSAEENVEVPLFIHPMSALQRKRSVEAALSLVGLSDRVKHKPSELSGGQQQRVSIARAIVADPSILVCDEPTGDLDRSASESILSLLQELNRHHGKTIVMVTHDPRAADHASRQVHLDKGKTA